MSILQNLTTEARNPASMNIDSLTAREIVQLMNEQDSAVAAAVATQAEAIAQAIDVIADRLRGAGRLIYMGAGTSGRLGVLDATECPPTFNSPPGQVVGLIAGGYEALTRAVEGAEDRPELAEHDLNAVQAGPRDVVVGIATSGRTPYVVAGLALARKLGCYTIALACNEDSSVSREADLAITPVVGPEVISGSTRLKAGTATKMVLNMLTTGAMVRTGKTFGNLMVDLRATNSKLRDRTRRIVETLVQTDADAASSLLTQCDGELKTAIIVGRTGCLPEQARERLQRAGGHVGSVLADAQFPDSGLHSRSGAESSSLDAQSPGLSTHRVEVVHSKLVLGIDGGGTRTTALLASSSASRSDGSLEILGRGVSGPSNHQAVGQSRALQSLREAIDQAFSAAGISRGEVAAVCLGLAGADRPADRAMLSAWAADCQIARKVRIENDASLVLAAGTPLGWGVAVIAGTGSIALARNAAGQVARAGGWGYLFGDEGSGYAIALAGLRAVVRAADRRGPPTAMTPQFLARLNVENENSLVHAVYGAGLDRPAIAALADIVTEAAVCDDRVAKSILDQAARELADAAIAAVRAIEFPSTRIPLATAGSLLLASQPLRVKLTNRLQEQGIHPEPIGLVNEPAIGAIRMARESLSVV